MAVLEQVMRLLVLRPGALGDTLLAAPALAALRARRGGVRVVFAGHPGAAALLRDSGLVDVALSLDDDRLTGLFGAGGDLAVAKRCLGPIDAAVAWLSDREGLVAGNLRRLGAHCVVVAPSAPAPGSGRHVALHLLETLAPLGADLQSVPPGPLLAATADDGDWADAFLQAARARPLPTVVLHPGSGGRRKNWPAGAFAAVVDLLGADYEVVLLGGPADDEALAGVLSAARRRPVVARGLPLRRVAGLLARCGAFLGNDAGIAHLAGLLGLPTVVLFGPTDPRLWRPWGPCVEVLSWAAGADSLDPAAVAAAVKRLLREGGRG